MEVKEQIKLFNSVIDMLVSHENKKYNRIKNNPVIDDTFIKSSSDVFQNLGISKPTTKQLKELAAYADINYHFAVLTTLIIVKDMYTAELNTQETQET